MKSYRVRYELDETGWWVASIDEVPGCHTQGRTLEQSRDRVREALASLTSHRKAASAHLIDDIVVPAPARKAVAFWHAKKDEASRIAAECENATRDAAVLLAKSMSLRDVGTVLGVSRQRAHQLVEDPRRKPVGRKAS